MKCCKCSGYCIFEQTLYLSFWRCFNCGKYAFAKDPYIRIDYMEFFLRQLKSKPVYAKQLLKPCKHCKVMFPGSKYRKLYCSPECAQISTIKAHLDFQKVCILCDRHFNSRNRNKIFCSLKCKYIANNRRKRACKK